jgi:SWI/SNF-related matrix-associated actin-dependent regulator 1 of chromatin subfamily A
MIPCPIGLEYMPFQQDAIEFGRGKNAVLFGDEPGLGKTIEAIGFLNCRPEIEELLIVCPKSLLTNWKRELDKWLISPFVNAKVINYDKLAKLDINRTWDVVVFDESHYAKSRGTLRSRLCRQIKARYRLALTGTPVLNRPEELFHQLHLLDPVAWPMSSYKKYTIRYCNAHMGKWGWDVRGASNLDELRELLKPLMIRRLKKDVLRELPDKRYQIIELPATGLTEDLLRDLAYARMHIRDIEDTYARDVQKLNSALTVAWNEMSALRHEIGLAKVAMAIEIIEDSLEGGGKIVVFAHHRDVIEALRLGLDKYRPAVVHGGTYSHVRQWSVDQFQNEPKCRVFIGQIQAAGVGITLTASSHVVFVEYDWTPGVMSQAEDRVHRIGQKESVLVQHLVLEDSMDLHMAKALLRKQKIINKVMG